MHLQNFSFSLTFIKSGPKVLDCIQYMIFNTKIINKYTKLIYGIFITSMYSSIILHLFK